MRKRIKRRVGEAVAEELTKRLTDELGKALGLPTRNGWSFRVNPVEKSVWIGFRAEF